MFFTFMTVCVGFIFTIEALLSLRSRLLSRRIWANLIYAGATFITVHCLLYLTIGYNVVSCFEAARIAAEVERKWMYPDFWHYLYASSANLTAFLIQTGIVTVALWGQETAENWAAWWKKAGTDFLSISLSLALIVLAFATIFCAETERIWMFLMPLVILAAARQLDRNHNGGGGFAPFAGVLILLFAQTLTNQLLLNNFW